MVLLAKSRIRSSSWNNESSGNENATRVNLNGGVDDLTVTNVDDLLLLSRPPWSQDSQHRRRNPDDFNQEQALGSGLGRPSQLRQYI